MSRTCKYRSKSFIFAFIRLGMGRRSRVKRNTRHLRRVRVNNTKAEDQPPEWVININNCLKEGHVYDSGRSWTIYRVPQNMREVHRNAYVPKIISIGPFHYLDRRLQIMEEHKMRYLLRVLGCRGQEHEEQIEETNEAEARTGQSTVQLEDLVTAMKVLEQRTRACYSEEFDDIDSDDFVQMMVVDGCFVVELLRLYHRFDKNVSPREMRRGGLSSFIVHNVFFFNHFFYLIKR